MEELRDQVAYVEVEHDFAEEMECYRDPQPIDQKTYEEKRGKTPPMQETVSSGGVRVRGFAHGGILISAGAFVRIAPGKADGRRDLSASWSKDPGRTGTRCQDSLLF